jgi:hypothetical protein
LLPGGRKSCKRLAQFDGVGDRYRDHRCPVHGASANHIWDRCRLGDLDLERGPSCGVSHELAAGWAATLADRRALGMGVLLRERECLTGLGDSSSCMPSVASDVELMVPASSTLA